MKKTLVLVFIVLLLCLGLTPVLAGGPASALTSAPYVAASSPVAKGSSLAPFVHVRNSTVATLYDGIGYVDSVVTIDNGVLNGTYTNTTEINTVPTNPYELRWISVYGSSQITINNTNMPLVILYVSGSSQVTIINSTLNAVFAIDSSVVTANNSNIPDGIFAGGNSKIYLSESELLFLGPSLYDNSYLNANNCTLGTLDIMDFSNMLVTNNCYIGILSAGNFSTGQITNNSAIGVLTSLEAANILVDNSTIILVDYGLVCNKGSLLIDGTTPPDLTYCRNTTTLTNGNYPTPSLVSVCALTSSNVNITNNNTINQVYAHDSSNVNLVNDVITGTVLAYDSSNVNLENTSVLMGGVICTDYSNTVYRNSVTTLTISAIKHSSFTLQNVTAISGTVDLAEQSSATIKNSSLTLFASSLTISTYDQSKLDLENITVTGIAGNFIVSSYDSSVANIANVTASGIGITTIFDGYDLSVMTIKNSTITNVDYAAKSNGDISINNGVISGPYIITTSWDTTPTNTPALNSIAVVGRHKATISGPLSINVYLHDSANLITQNNTIDSYIYTHGYSQLSAKNTTFSYDFTMYDFSKLSATNTTFGNIYLVDQCSVSLSNITGGNFGVGDSATLVCTGNTSAPSTIQGVIAFSSYPNMANVVIDNCTVTGSIEGATWIFQAGVNYTLLLLSFYYFLSSSSQNQGFVFTLSLAGVAIIAIVAVAAAILWRRRA